MIHSRPVMFLKPLVDEPDGPWALLNVRSGLVLAKRLEPAFDSKARRRGLLGREGLAPGAALVIAPCSAIHTFFLRFTIDALFVRRDGRVAKVCPSLAAWRIGVSWNSFAVIELAAGTAAHTDTRVGDNLRIVR